MIYWFLHLLVRHRNNHELLEKRTATRLQPKDRGVLANLFWTKFGLGSKR